jgi:ABC-type antimicrobial peptide transport system permease subunit
MELVRENSELDERNITHYYLQALNDIHLDPTYNSFQGAYTTSSKFLWIFISVGLFILIIASINFINLSTVQALRRTREIGVRKILGADRLKIIRQFLGETVLLLLAAEILALIVAEIILPHAGDVLGSDIKISLYQDYSVIVFMIVVLVVFGFIAGSYPALFLSRYKPLQALRSRPGGSGKKNLTIFGSLVILQFFISQVLIIGSIIANQQIDFFQNKDLGFETKNILTCYLNNRGETDHKAFHQALRQIPEVRDVTLGIGAPLANSNIKSGMVLPGREEERYPANVKTVDENYLRFYDLPLLTGRMFTQTEDDSVRDALINEQLLYDMGFDDPNDVLGKTLLGFGGSNRVVGVVKNFHTQSLHGDMGGTLLTYVPRYFITASVKLQEGYDDETIKKVRQTWEEFYPGQIFNYEFLEESISNQYQKEERTSMIVQTFTIVAIIIAILGLYGLVSFMLIQRTKEIGIRKTQGATVGGIIRLLSGSYLKYILVAGLLAWPVAWYLLKQWLQDFAYHVDLHPGYFVLATGLLLLISFATIIYQTMKTANTNPANTLRDE